MKRARWIPALAVMGAALLFLGCERPPEVQYVEVDSTLIEAVQYDGDTQTLSIRFIDPPATYEYAGVPPSVYAELLAADSKGRFFHEALRGHYEETRVSD